MTEKEKIAEIKFYQALQKSATTLSGEYEVNVATIRAIKAGQFHTDVTPQVPEKLTKELLKQIPLANLLKAMDEVYGLKMSLGESLQVNAKTVVKKVIVKKKKPESK